MKQIKRSVKLADEGSRRGWIKTEGEDDLRNCALSVASANDSLNCPRRLRLNLPSVHLPCAVPSPAQPRPPLPSSQHRLPLETASVK